MHSLASASCSRPSTTFHVVPSVVTGYPNCRPSGVPYSPLLHTASDVQSPWGVAERMLFTESMTALAADAADERLRASITAAPRFWTVLMKSPLSQAWSLITSKAGRSPIRELRASGYWVAEWLPQIAMLVTEATGAPAFFASCVLARFSSRRVMANHRSAGTSDALERAMRQLVLQGFPTTRLRTSRAALAWMALPCGAKMPPLMARRSPRSIPALRGTEP